MRRGAGLAVAAAVAALLSCNRAPAEQREQQPVQQYGPEIRPTERFRGETVVQTPRGAVPVRVIITNWSISGGQEIDELPLETRGFMLVQLRGGQITTVIAGERQERAEDEVWTVPEDVRMGLITGDDSAILQTIVVTE